MSASDISAIVSAAFTALAFFALLWYTWETSRLRKATERQQAINSDLLLETQKLREAAQRQNESALLPILMLVQSTAARNNAVEILAVRNVGSGPAFNVRIMSMKVSELEFRFETMPTISMGLETPVHWDVLHAPASAPASTNRLVDFWNAINRIARTFEGRMTILYSAADSREFESRIIVKNDGHQVLLEGVRKSG